MHKFSSLAALIAALAFPFLAAADPVTLAVSGTYSDNSTFSGSIVYDQSNQQVTSGTITDGAPAAFFGGSLAVGPETYDGSAQTFTITSPSGCQSNCNWFGLEFYTSANPTSLPYLDLFFYGDPSTFTGGAIQSSISYVDYFGDTDTSTSQEAIGEGLTRPVTGGSVGAATPEPASLLLLAPAAILLITRKRRPA